MVTFTTTIKKFGEQGEKTGWYYVEVPAEIAEQLKPNFKKSFRVKGKIDAYEIEGIALVPMGGGNYILAMNADIRKGTHKSTGAMVTLQLKEDEIPYQQNADFIACLADEPNALEQFKTLPLSHQNYFSRWIDSAKTPATKAKRITQAVQAMLHKWDYPQMIRWNRDNSF